MIHCITAWMMTCTLFVFGALVEYAALLLWKKILQQEETKKGHTPKVDFLILIYQKDISLCLIDKPNKQSHGMYKTLINGLKKY